MKMNINNLLLLLCETYPKDKFTVTMVKGHNKEDGYIYTKHVLHKNGKEAYYSYSSRTFMVYLSDLIDDANKTA